jgi:hypothetical protein
MLRYGVAIVLCTFSLAAPAGAHDVPFYWSITKVMRAVDDTRVRVGTNVVRIRADTTLCAGEGRSRRRGGVRQWRHFRCTHTTRRGLGRDIDFRVHVLGVRRFVITDARWVADVP